MLCVACCHNRVVRIYLDIVRSCDEVTTHIVAKPTSARASNMYARVHARTCADGTCEFGGETGGSDGTTAGRAVGGAGRHTADGGINVGSIKISIYPSIVNDR